MKYFTYALNSAEQFLQTAVKLILNSKQNFEVLFQTSVARAETSYRFITTKVVICNYKGSHLP